MGSKLPDVFRGTLEPVVICTFVQNQNLALFFFRPVVALEQRVVICRESLVLGRGGIARHAKRDPVLAASFCCCYLELG